MADLVLTSKDAVVDVNAGLGGLHRITVTCRNYKRVFAPNELQEFADLLYPALNAEAEKYDSAAPAAPPDTAA